MRLPWPYGLAMTLFKVERGEVAAVKFGPDEIAETAPMG